MVFAKLLPQVQVDLSCCPFLFWISLQICLGVLSFCSSLITGFLHTQLGCCVP